MSGMRFQKTYKLECFGMPCLTGIRLSTLEPGWIHVQRFSKSHGDGLAKGLAILYLLYNFS